MSKGRVWNKGKHNGGGVSATGKAIKALNKSKSETEAAQPVIPIIDMSDPKNQVKPMNRENWVSRPVRVKPSNNSEQK
ncbi:hypothetical protein Back11_20290 [Paenibacillus baekrokdamisoli]|uniref:Uncharacterized protein n=1 Tax=Paenibacillus baekrokdamisoli TaxID=1712516 RepID=A0A3G9JBN3_9BACL|nr:hypothetical protein [Paenibacillus baekrokdamisoli]MBB3069965.1 hypothetical protein [Paenibacillus baekrokdamisoli]BBH20684.1 hypothetical protein Back11_20290 [Paenibacillus baekrokdamisoli]